MQEEPRHRHGHNHVHGKRTNAVLGVCAALNEERRNRARRQQHQAAVHRAVGNAVVGVSEVPQVVANDPEPQLVGPNVVFLLAAANDDAKETADAQRIQNAGDAVHHIPWTADHHVAVHDAVDARELEVTNARFENIDRENNRWNAHDVFLLEGGEVHNEPSENRAREARIRFHPLKPRARACTFDSGVGPNENGQGERQSDENRGATHLLRRESSFMPIRNTR